MKLIIVHKWFKLVWDIDDSLVSNLDWKEVIQSITDWLLSLNNKKKKEVCENILGANNVSDLFNEK